ncbi:hypothetical protein RO3G_05859 [Rhizopus delemar RA 99-880]|uniref:Uncharacterized protein n=1 Tax=Rhizopus delemar (strain RA 99-880 / ATCC MYA-4621 / FGSC 9543 / NRRL 43880) TaxID=246409 RepID=I1BY74_RHIO9|nr:hypothetical protein RO3G_05859 [Rhizopus delemar RA 99-880]|eukprot:EIE81154.1 hypothetical protein RO3G_05859 [Rhizopus delemar RA 99-880]
MKELGKMYLQELSIVYESRREECTTEESSKVDMLDNDSFLKINTSPQIQKLLRLAVYSAQALNDAIDNRLSSAENSQTSNGQGDSVELRHYQTLSIDEQMIFLCDKFGNQGHLDFTTTTISKRFGKSIKDFGLKLQPTLIHMNPMCRYIRLALSNMVEIWSSDGLVTADHNESWYRTHVYGPVFDNAFIYDKNFITKRADCISNITKEFDDIPNQRVDFILRNLNDDTDYFSAEEKPGVKGVKKDISKGKTLQMAMLRKWTQYVGNSRISNLEAITCQWQGVKLQRLSLKLWLLSCP